MKVNRKELRKLINEAISDKPNYSHYGIDSFIAPKTYVNTSNPDEHAKLAIILLENIIKEISQVPEKNLKKYVEYIANQKLPEVILEIKKTGMVKWK